MAEKEYGLPPIGPGNPTYDETFKQVTEHREKQLASACAERDALKEGFMKLREFVDNTRGDAIKGEFHRGWAVCCDMVIGAIDLAFKGIDHG